jgi:hypothetical protein
MGLRLMKLTLCACACMMLLLTAEAFQGLMPPQHSTLPLVRTASSTTTLNAGGFLRRFRKGSGAATIDQARYEIGVGASLPEVDVEVLNTDDDGKVYTEIRTVSELLADTDKAIVLGKQFLLLPAMVMLDACRLFPP